MVVRGVNRIILAVRDLQKAMSYYADLLGATPTLIADRVGTWGRSALDPTQTLLLAVAIRQHSLR